MKPTKYMRYARKHMGIKPASRPRKPVKPETAAERTADVERILAMPVSWMLIKQAD